MAEGDEDGNAPTDKDLQRELTIVQIEKGRLNIERVRQQVDQGRLDIDRIRQELEKDRLNMDRIRQELEKDRLNMDQARQQMRYEPIRLLVSAVVAAAALLGAGVGIGNLIWAHRGPSLPPAPIVIQLPAPTASPAPAPAPSK